MLPPSFLLPSAHTWVSFKDSPEHHVLFTGLNDLQAGSAKKGLGITGI